MRDHADIIGRVAAPRMRVCAAADYRRFRPGHGCHPLVSLCFDDAGRAREGWELAPVPAVAAGEGAVERWYASTPPARWNDGPVRMASAGQLLFAALTEDQASGETLEDTARRAYQRLLGAMADSGIEHPVRIWNFIPHINAPEQGLERYRRFCIGRHEAFRERGWLDGDRFPAASAVGIDGGSLHVHVLAARSPGRQVENPRQVSAYRYPREYGPRSPAFARATAVGDERGGTLIVSGTAAVVGHRSRRPDDPVAQARETLANLRALIEQARSRTGWGLALSSRSAALRVYLRHGEHGDAVRDVIERELSSDLPLAMVRADICRPELLVEFEGVVHSEPFCRGMGR